MEERKDGGRREWEEGLQCKSQFIEVTCVVEWKVIGDMRKVGWMDEEKGGEGECLDGW